MALLVGAAPVPAAAQSDAAAPAFLNVGVGAQPQRHTVTAATSFPLYDETATIAAVQHIRNGALFEVGGGFRLARRLSFGAAFSMFGRPGSGSLTASIPDPIFYSRPATVSTDANDLAHAERDLHLQAIWFLPVSPKFDVSLSAGPSILHVSQDIATASVASATQSVTVARTTESATAVGFNAGVQGNYMFAPRYGVGLFVGYAGGSIDLPSATDTKVGGLRTGLALQVRF
jgi:hypothetical protein